jgi:predicted AAA+ superfamily ATPase
MKPFSTVAIPHRDILEGRFTKDTFAANLWEVYKGKAGEEYINREIFFNRTHLTEGMKVLIDKVMKRLKGESGDSVIQLQTPFGGGKTHSLIALYHKATELGAKVVVFDGSAVSPKEVLIWEEIERQITGEVKAFKGNVPPAGENIKNIFSKYKPLLILIDELTDYTISASAIKVNNSYLSDLVLNFMRFLSGYMPDKCVLVITYPSKAHYPEQRQQKILNALQERTGRVSEPYSPIRDEDISEVVQKRLFEEINKKEAEKIIDEYIKYAEDEKLLPQGIDKITYKERFLKSYPFQPEVVEVLYKRWGSYPKFQRTRGVLYLLACVVYQLRDTHLSYIKLSDFDLNDNKIREILIDVIGPEWNSILSQDITSPESGAKKVDKSLPPAYAPYKLGTKVATSIFLHSFSAGPERGAKIEEIKLTSADISVPSSIIVEVVNKLKEPLTSLYLDFREEKYLYVTEVPLTKALSSKMNMISENEIKEEEKSALKRSLTNEYFEVIIWGKNSKDIPDTKKLKLVVMECFDEKLCKEFLEQCGDKPRIYRNTIIFMCPMEQEKENIENFFREKLAWQYIEKDKTLHISDEQRKEVREKIKKIESEVKERIRNFYRILLVPLKDGFKQIDLGIATYGIENINKEIYERLKSEAVICEKLHPLVIKDRYLKDKDYVETKKILESFYQTPGEIIMTNENVLKDAIKKGVKDGLFGFGSIENGKPVCKHFKDDCFPELVEEEIITKKELCQKPEPPPEHPIPPLTGKEEEKTKEEESLPYKPLKEKYSQIILELNVPIGKLADIGRMINFMQEKFNQISIKIEISAQDGEISKSEYEDKIKEALKQAEVKIEKEDKK